MAAAAHRSGHVLDVLIDVDLGMGRTGVGNLESALRLVDAVCNARGLCYRGLQAYSGRVQHIEEFQERDAVYSGQLRLLSGLIAALDKRGLKPATVSGGGTGTLALDCREGMLTEHQAGSYIFMDVEYGAVSLGANDADAPFATSLFLHSTVISKNVPGMVTIDAGLKSFATDGPLPRVSGGAPGERPTRFSGMSTVVSASQLRRIACHLAAWSHSSRPTAIQPSICTTPCTWCEGTRWSIYGGSSGGVCCRR